MNYYEILGLSKNATQTEIKRSYKKLVKKYHPDVNSGDKTFAEQAIKQINEAYAILSNSEKKLAYDETLKPSFETTYKAPETETSNTQTAESAFTNFMVEKLNHLTVKRQIQIFVLIFLITLSLFFMNLFQVSYYLTPSSDTNITATNTTNTTLPNNPLENALEDFDYNQTELDDVLNDFWKSHFEEDYSNYEF